MADDRHKYSTGHGTGAHTGTDTLPPYLLAMQRLPPPALTLSLHHFPAISSNELKIKKPSL